MSAPLTDAERAHAELRLIADSVPIHLLHLDLDERILFANKAAAETWGLEAEGMAGKTIREIVGEEGYRVLQVYTHRVARGETVVYEAPFRTKDGSTRYFLNTYAPEWSSDGKVSGFVATGTDITERKLAEEALQASKRQEEAARKSLEEERELRNQFISMLTHDMRTPLTAARLSAQLSLRRAEEPEEVRRLVARLIENLDRTDAMLRDMLDANRLQAGQMLAVTRTECDLNALTEEVLLELSTLHGPRFVLKAASRIRSQWDCSGIRRVIENLCSNAVKYGAPEAPITLTLELAADGATACLAAHNRGEPIPASELRHLFEPFRRTTIAHASGKTGWGLGLTLVKGIAEAHGGSVTVTSDETSGTTFRVILPVAPASPLQSPPR
jgi:PAS domain S-box-containing protein